MMKKLITILFAVLFANQVSAEIIKITCKLASHESSTNPSFSYLIDTTNQRFRRDGPDREWWDTLLWHDKQIVVAETFSLSSGLISTSLFVLDRKSLMILGTTFSYNDFLFLDVDPTMISELVGKYVHRCVRGI